MKLWVADKVLCDWSCGMVVIHAKNEKEALEELCKDDFLCWQLCGTPNCECHKDSKMNLSAKFIKYHKPERLPLEFKLIEGTSCHAVSGGG